MFEHFVDNSTTMTAQYFLSYPLLGKRPNSKIGTQDDPASKTLGDTEQEPPIPVTTNAKEIDVSREYLIRRIISISSFGTSSLKPSSDPRDDNEEGIDDGRDSFSEDDNFDFIYENHYAFRDEVDIYRRKGCKFLSKDNDSLDTGRRVKLSHD